MNSLRRWFLTPAVIFLLLFFAAPLVIVFLYSFHERGVYGEISPGFSVGNYIRLVDPLYGAIFLRTFLLAGVSTLGCLILGFPLALFISRAGNRRNLYLQLVMLPFWTSFLIRTYAWMFLLRDTGLVNSALESMGLIHSPLPLLFNTGSVILGLVYGYLPFMVLPLYATLEKLDPALLDAAEDLGANPWQAVWHVAIPIAKPGIVAGCVLVFIPCLGAFLTPDLMGGGKTVMIGNLVQNQFTTARDWPFGAAVSFIFMTAVLVVMGALRRSAEEIL